MKVTTLLWNAKRSFAWCFFVLLSLSAWMIPAGRCAEGQGKVIKLEDVRVSAGKMETVVEKIPTNIEVITREDIEKTPGVVYVNDLLQQVPGLYAPRFQSGVANDGVFSMRGSELSPKGLRIMVNGIELNKGNGYVVLPRLPLHDVERIEIIKTASAEYGDQAVGGIINVVTRVSDKPIEAKVGGALGSFQYGTSYTVLNGSNDKWEYFVDLGFSRSDGYQDDTEYNPVNLYTRLAYAINDTMDVEFHGSHMDSEGVWPGDLTQAEFDEDPTQSPGRSDPFENDYDLAALVLKKRFGDDELKMKLIGKDERVTMNFDFPFGDREYEGEEWEVYPALTYAWREALGNMHNQLVLGAEYRKHEHISRTYSVSGSTRQAKLKDTLRKDTSFAAYAVNELSVTDALTVTLGARYDSYEGDQTGRVDPAKSFSQTDDGISPKIGATYTVNEGLNIFAGFNSGFKSPARVAGMQYTPGLDPEKVHSYEAGCRGAPLPWLSYSVTGFINQYKDKLLRTGSTPEDPYINAGDTEANGLELSLGTDFTSGLFADLSYTYQEAEFEDYVDAAGVSLDGKKIPNVPEQLLGLIIGYRHSVWGQITLNADYVGNRYFNNENTLKGDDYWILGAGFKKTFSKWDPQVSFFIDIKNLTDEEEVLIGDGSPGDEELKPVYGRGFLFGLELLF